jgi:hypothetical protein
VNAPYSGQCFHSKVLIRILSTDSPRWFPSWPGRPVGSYKRPSYVSDVSEFRHPVAPSFGFGTNDFIVDLFVFFKACMMSPLRVHLRIEVYESLLTLLLCLRYFPYHCLLQFLYIDHFGLINTSQHARPSRCHSDAGGKHPIYVRCWFYLPVLHCSSSAKALSTHIDPEPCICRWVYYCLEGRRLANELLQTFSML